MRRLLLIAFLLVPSLSNAQTETIEYYGEDVIGSIRIVFAPSGQVLARQDYEPFGRSLFSVPSLSGRAFGGAENDDETNWQNFHVRQLAARIGRFNRVDPIFDGLFEPQKWNRYSYAVNNPLVMVDPDGMDPKRDPKKCTADIKPLNEHDWHCESDQGTYIIFTWTGSFAPNVGRGRDGRGTIIENREGRRTGSGNNSGESSSTDNNGGNGTGNPGSDDGDDQGEDCSRTGAARVLPDYVSVQFSAGFVWGGTVHISMDRYANAFFGIGPSAGRADPVSGSVTFGYLQGSRTQKNSLAVNTQLGGSASAGFGVGYQAVSVPGTKGAMEYGLFTPQIGAGVSYSWYLGGVGSICK